VAPPRRHAAPESQIVALLAECRRRGYSFDAAWHATVLGGGRLVLNNDRRPPELAIKWPTDPPTRREVFEAITQTQDAYRRAYDREPATAADLAVLALWDLLGEWEEAEARPTPTYRTKGTGGRTRIAQPAKTPVAA
jgi:hypothetical protein